jgi:phage terminase large subunit
MIKQTKALQKIAALRKRNWVIQGGQGAGKTFAILILIANYADRNPDKEIFIASAELTKMRITVIKDFVKILKAVGIYDKGAFTSGTLYRFANGSFVKFIGLDKEDIGKGLRSDLVFINEANKVPFEAYRELTSRAKRVIVDFNPNNKFWVHTDVLTRPDVDYLNLTYIDNEELSQEEIFEIEYNKIRAYHNPDLAEYDIPSNIKSEYWRNKWRIYGLGIIGSNPNRVFTWPEISLYDYQQINEVKYYGSDWGTVDPWGVIEAKYYDGNLYLHELNYASENLIKTSLTPTELMQVSATDEGLIKWNFERIGVPMNGTIICDDNRPLKVKALREAGYDYAITAIKGPGSVIDGIDTLQKLNVFFTSTSENLRYEQENYCRMVEKLTGTVLEEPEDKNNHLIDPARYIATFLKVQGIIKVI